MKTLSQQKWIVAQGFPVLIFICCVGIAFSTAFKERPDLLAPAITLDLCLIAPLLYFLTIRKTTASKASTFRVFLIGIFITGLLISKEQSILFNFLKTWISPVIETSLIGFVLYKLWRTRKNTQHPLTADWFTQAKDALFTIMRNKKLAHILAGELAVFYYAFFSKRAKPDGRYTFSIYQTNGILLILGTFLSLFVIETVGMHFLFTLWNPTAAWIITGLSAYSCIQLYGHICAVKARPVVLSAGSLVLRNGLMGGEAWIPLTQIEKITFTKKPVNDKDTQKLALIKGLENHNIAIYLKAPITITKAFGIEKPAKVVLVNIDQHDAFLNAFDTYSTITQPVK